MSYWESSGKSNEWYTPKFIFDALDCRFDLDVAAPEGGPRYVPCNDWLFHDALNEPWHGFIWMNPPFEGRNGLEPWLRKFVQHGNGIALTPDRTSAPWFQMAAPWMDLILFLPKVKFERPDRTLGKSPSNGTALMAMGNSGFAALHRAAHLGACFQQLRTKKKWLIPEEWPDRTPAVAPQD